MSEEKQIKIYNRGQRRFDHNDISVHPGRFTSVPESIANKLLTGYPNEIVTSETQDAAGAVKDEQLEKQAAEIAELKAKLAALEAPAEEKPKAPAKPAPAPKPAAPKVATAL